MPEVACYFCQNSFNSRDTLTRMHYGEARDASTFEQDEVVGRFFGLEKGNGPPLPPILPTRRGLLGGRTPQKGDLICPLCRMPIPPAIADGRLRPYTLALVGARRSGKSNYFAKLIPYLQNVVFAKLGIAFRGLTTYDGDRHRIVTSKDLYEVRYGRRIRDGESIPITLPAAQDPAIRCPLVYRLTRDTDQGGRVLDLAMFDAAGEDLQQIRELEHFNRYILNASAILLIMSPHDCDGLELEPLEEEAGGGAYRAVDVLENILNLIDTAGRRVGTKVEIPTAVALSMLDEFADQIGPDSPLHAEPDWANGFDEAESLRIHDELMDRLMEWGGGGVAATLRNEFARFRVFAFSALGHRPEQGRIHSDLLPVRGADPILWILRELGFPLDPAR